VQNSPRRAYDQIRSAIRSGIIPHGDQLVEDTLTSTYATSRNSVREALQSLAQDGLVTRDRGRGTLVSGAITQLTMNTVLPVGSNGEIGTRNSALSHAILDVVIVPASPTVQARLDTDDDILLVEHLAFLERPVYVGAFYYVCPQDGRDEFVERVTNAHRSPGVFGKSLLTTHGVDIGRVEGTVEALACDNKTARLLEVEVGSPILLRERVVHDATGKPVALDYVHFSGSYALATVTQGGDTAVVPIVS
jgi:GntR family transcriptional regulator